MKRKLIPELSLSENFRLALSEENLSFSDLSKKASVGAMTVYRLVERTPLLVTSPLLRIARTLNFQESDIRERIRVERAIRKVSYSKKGRFYELISELIELFEKERR